MNGTRRRDAITVGPTLTIKEDGAAVRTDVDRSEVDPDRVRVLGRSGS